MVDNTIKITQTKSAIGYRQRTKDTLKALGLRKMNVTRVQLGVQHIDDDILKFIKRDCYLKDTILSNFRLKQNGYKVDIHFMPDLPSSTFNKDMIMFQKLFSHTKKMINKNHIQYTLKYPKGALESSLLTMLPESR